MIKELLKGPSINDICDKWVTTKVDNRIVGISSQSKISRIGIYQLVDPVIRSLYGFCTVSGFASIDGAIRHCARVAASVC